MKQLKLLIALILFSVSATMGQGTTGPSPQVSVSPSAYRINSTDGHLWWKVGTNAWYDLPTFATVQGLFGNYYSKTQSDSILNANYTPTTVLNANFLKKLDSSLYVTPYNLMTKNYLNSDSAFIKIGRNNAAKYYEKIRLGSSVTIACEGTSITYGQDGSGTNAGINGSTNVRSSHPYPETMDTTLKSIDINATVINRGFPGDQSTDWLARWGTATAVDAVILEYAANDPNNYGGRARGVVDIPSHKANMIAIIKKHLLQGAYVIISLPVSDPTYANDLKTRLYGQADKEIAEQFNLPTIDPKQIMSWVGNIYLTKTSPHLNSTALAEWGSQAAAIFTDRGKTPFEISGSEKYSAYNGLLGSYGESIASANSAYANFINIPANGYRYMVVNVKQKVGMYLKTRSASGTRTLTAQYGNGFTKPNQVISVTTSTVRQNSFTLDQGTRLVIFKGGATAPYIDEIGFEYSGADKMSVGAPLTSTNALIEATDPTTLQSTQLSATQLRFMQPNSTSPSGMKHVYFQSTPNATLGNILQGSYRTDLDGFGTSVFNIFYSGKMTVGSSSVIMFADANFTGQSADVTNFQFNARSMHGYAVPLGSNVGEYGFTSVPNTPLTPYTSIPGFRVSSIRAVATQLHSGTVGGTRMAFDITPNGSIVKQEQMSLSESGLSVIGKITASLPPTNASDVVRKTELDLKDNLPIISAATTTQTSATLNTSYPTAGIGQQVTAPSVGTGMKYEKITSTTWVAWAVTGI